MVRTVCILIAACASHIGNGEQAPRSTCRFMAVGDFARLSVWHCRSLRFTAETYISTSTFLLQSYTQSDAHVLHFVSMDASSALKLTHFFHHHRCRRRLRRRCGQNMFVPWVSFRHSSFFALHSIVFGVPWRNLI